MTVLAETMSSRGKTYRALNNYHKFAKGRNWPIGGSHGKLAMYDLGRKCFLCPTDDQSAIAAFLDLYGMIRSWPGVARGGELASASTVNGLLNRHMQPFHWNSGLDLRTFGRGTARASVLLDALPTLRAIKRNPVNYPWMAVSKVLHFVNPSLFPIWDTDVLWKLAMWGQCRAGNAPLHADWLAFCKRSGFNPEEMGARFQHDYTLWAVEAIRCADPEFMRWFSAWMMDYYRDDICHFGLESLIPNLYATAFEFIAIGVSIQ